MNENSTNRSNGHGLEPEALSLEMRLSAFAEAHDDWAFHPMGQTLEATFPVPSSDLAGVLVHLLGDVAPQRGSTPCVEIHEGLLGISFGAEALDRRLTEADLLFAFTADALLATKGG